MPAGVLEVYPQSIRGTGVLPAPLPNPKLSAKPLIRLISPQEFLAVPMAPLDNTRMLVSSLR